MRSDNPIVLLRGGGDLATGVAARLHRAAFRVLVVELPAPLAVRRTVSAAQAVFSGEIKIEELHAHLASGIDQVHKVWAAGDLPVMIDPEASSADALRPMVIVDARMRKRGPEWDLRSYPLGVGLGPGFVAGENCHAVVETRRGHTLGRVIWNGAAAPDSGVPDPVFGLDADRVLRAPRDGHVAGHAQIGDLVQQGDLLAEVAGAEIRAAFAGVLRGLVHESVEVRSGMKVGDLDPRSEPSHAFLISDKALAIGGGVLEAVLAQEQIRQKLG